MKRLALGWLCWSGVLAAAGAHQLDQYLQTMLVCIEPSEIKLKMNLNPGIAIAEKIIECVDENHDGAFSTNEVVVCCERLRQDLSVRLDGSPLSLRLVRFEFPEPEDLRDGGGVMQVEFVAKVGSWEHGPHTVACANRHQSSNSFYLFNAALPKSRDIQITRQTRNATQSAGEIRFTAENSAAWRASLLAPMPFLVSMAGVGLVIGKTNQVRNIVNRPRIVLPPSCLPASDRSKFTCSRRRFGIFCAWTGLTRHLVGTGL